MPVKILNYNFLTNIVINSLHLCIVLLLIAVAANGWRYET